MRLLITGGAGFIGSNFIRHVLKKYPDYKITNLDKLTYAGNPENLKDAEANRNYSFVKGDICDKALVGKLTKSCDAVINFAACSHVDRSILEPEEFIRTNVFGTYTLLEFSRTNGVKLFIQIGTDEVYGSIQGGFSKESDPLEPNSPYSASKAAADLLSRSYFVTHKLPVIITRSSNNYGPYQYPEKVIPLFITNLMESKKVPLYGDGMNVRDWLYVLDNCSALDVVLHKGKPGEIYNIGGGTLLSNKDLTLKILKAAGKTEEMIEPVKDRLGHDRRYALDCEKVKRLGWSPEHGFDKALKETFEWYRKNKEWWQRLKNDEFLEYYNKQYGVKSVK
jgi:dTDP-glucose 4,6-dehydratase